MSSSTKPCAVFQPEHDPLNPYIEEFHEHLRRSSLSERVILTYIGYARHFLTWHRQSGLDIQLIDDAVLRRFRDHDCSCPRYHLSWSQTQGRRLRNRLSGVLRLVGFFEQIGRTRHPGEQERARCLLNAFLNHLSENAYSASTRKSYRGVSTHLLVWLHQSRISIAALDVGAVHRFIGHDCWCGGFHRGISDNEKTRAAVNRFVEFLVSRGAVSDASLMPCEKRQPRLPEFAHWLRRHRGIQESTVNQHVRQVCSLLPHLGTAEEYNAQQIRDALLRRFQESSVSLAQAVAGSTRMYLRFLSTRGLCPPGLVGSVMSVTKWRLSSVPRYLEADEIERVIATCDPANPAGLRDRAMFLLMARLGLRAGDITALRFDHLDWINARIQVCGKSRRAVALPLPQDAGDAVLEYLEKARPRSDRQRLFLTAVAPYRPIGNVCTISNIVARALRRAGIEKTGPRGAHLFRHSAATALLRGGATLDEIQTLLRHRSSTTTAIYAKVDRPMLETVAQPWLGGGQ